MKQSYIIILICAFVLLYIIIDPFNNSYFGIGKQREGFVNYYAPDQPVFGAYLHKADEPVGANYDLIPKTAVITYDSARHKFIQNTFDQIVSTNSMPTDLPQDVNWTASTPSTDEQNGVIKYLLNMVNTRLTSSYALINAVAFNKDRYNDITRYTMTIFVVDTNNQNDTDYALRFSSIICDQGSNRYIISLRILDQVEDFFPGYDKYNTAHYRILNGLHLQAPFLTSDIEMQVTDDDIKRALEDKGVKSTVPNYLCFGSPDPNAQSREQCLATGGYWDTPVVDNAECPFYKANKNYPNERGGVNQLSGRCEMPLNTKIVGYRYYSQDPVYQPLCYNCNNGFNGPNTMGMCCNDQNDRIQYPNLSGPDFAFPDDTIDRRESAEYFNDRGVSWSRQGALFESKQT